MKHNTKYNYYVTVKNAAGSLRICSGWDYEEDAREGYRDVKECGIYKNVKIYTRKALQYININIDNHNLWIDYTAPDATAGKFTTYPEPVEITPEGIAANYDNIQDAINNLFDKIKEIKCIDNKLDVAFSAGALINTIHYNYNLYKKGGE